MRKPLANWSSHRRGLRELFSNMTGLLQMQTIAVLSSSYHEIEKKEA